MTTQKIFYSPSLRGFFDPAVHDPMPADVIPVTVKRYVALVAAQEQGAAIEPGENGKPALRWPDRSAAAQRAGLARRIRQEARRRCRSVSPWWRQANDLRAVLAGEAGPDAAARFARIDAVRAASNAIEALAAAAPIDALAAFPVRDHPLWPAAEQSPSEGAAA